MGLDVGQHLLIAGVLAQSMPLPRGNEAASIDRAGMSEIDLTDEDYEMTAVASVLDYFEDE
jgi:hypothetical protein